MFDVSFTELMLVGVIALIVIGPERLPKVARTIGHLVGRAQRYVSDVKTDIKREMDLDELNNLKGQMQEAAKSVKTSMQTATDELRKPLDEAQQALNEASASVDTLVHDIKADAAKEESKPDEPRHASEPFAEPAGLADASDAAVSRPAPEGLSLAEEPIVRPAAAAPSVEQVAVRTEAEALASSTTPGDASGAPIPTKAKGQA